MNIKIHQCTSRVKFPILAWIIMFVQRTDYSHYAIQLNSTHVIHANKKGVVVDTIEDFQLHYRTLRIFDFIIPKDTIIFDWVKEVRGRKYGFLQLWGISLVLLRIVKTNPFGRGWKRLTCNELILLFLNRFFGLQFNETDSYDLNRTEMEIKKVLKC